MLREDDVKLLWPFILRIEMYVGQESEERISSFLVGYEMGTAGKCEFIKYLSESIKNDYQIDAKATGWIGQIYKAAEKIQMDWIAIFKMQSIKILGQKINDYSISAELKRIYKLRLAGLLSYSDRVFDLEGVINWGIYLDLSYDWCNEIWTVDELLILKELNSELEDIKQRKLKTNNLKQSPKFTELKLGLIDKIGNES